EVAVATDELRDLSFDEQREHVLRELKQAYLLPPEAGVDDVLAPLRLLRRRENARRAYDPACFDGVVTLFRARDAEPDAGSELAGIDELRAQHPDLGWEGLAARVEVIEVPGDHVTLGTEPHARTLAALWSERLG
ncbi:MAG TPA: hypothetical protein VK420_12420, partial [Longimicrobium sp.]|nr:hypothetical protein [Longimicrobium sp.]